MPGLKEIWRASRSPRPPVVVHVAGNGARGAATGVRARLQSCLCEPMCLSYAPGAEKLYVGNSSPTADTPDAFVCELSLRTDEVRSVPIVRAFQVSGVSVSADTILLAYTTGRGEVIGITHLPSGRTAVVAGGSRGSRDGVGADAQFDWPAGVVLSADHTRVFLADRNNCLIRTCELSAVDPLLPATVSPLAGSGNPLREDGVGATASFAMPHSLALAADGRALFVGEEASIRLVDIATRVVRTFAGSGRQGYFDAIGLRSKFTAIFGLAVDAAGTIFCTDAYNHRVRAVYPDGVTRTVAGTGAAAMAIGPLHAASFRFPKAIAVTSNGALIVCEKLSSFILGIPCATTPSPHRYNFQAHLRFPRSVRELVRTLLVLARMRARPVDGVRAALARLPIELLAVLFRALTQAVMTDALASQPISS